MNNHGGDFTVQLDKTLDMRGESWEVALVDMIYTGQAFPNLPVEDVEITLKVEGKPQYENQYFITYDQTMDLRLTFKKNSQSGSHTVDVYLPRQHYSWASFITTLKQLCSEKLIDVELTEQEFRFADSLQDKDTEITISMSKDVCSLFGIRKKYDEVFDQPNQRRYFSFIVTNIPKPVEDTSQLFYGPYAVRNNCDIAVHDEVIFKLTPQYWTINMFKRAIIALGKSLPKDSRLSSMTIEEGSSPEKCTLVLTPTSNRKRQISYLPLMTIDFRLIFRPPFYIEKADYDLPYKIPLSIR